LGYSQVPILGTLGISLDSHRGANCSHVWAEKTLDTERNSSSSPLRVSLSRSVGPFAHCVRHQYFLNLAPDNFKLTVNRITNHPRLNFTVVINPASGPGVEQGPDSNYTREITKLNKHANVRTVGYVSTSYTNRNISLALRDIETYSAWSENSTIAGLGMQGIFLDETPSQYQAASAIFLDTLADSINSDTGFGKDPFVSVDSLMFQIVTFLCPPFQKYPSARIKQQVFVTPLQSGTRDRRRTTNYK